MNADSGETVVVVGGAGGIGSATVRKYTAAGCRIIIGDIDSGAAAILVNEPGIDAEFIPVNVLKYESIKNFAGRISENYGSVTHLVNLAGGSLPEETVESGIEGISPEHISTSIDLNLKSHLYLVKEFLPLIREDRSDNKSVTLISSVNALISFGQPAYSSAKAGMIGLVHALANELGSYNIRINAVLPGTTPTQSCDGFLKESYDLLRKASALKRLSTPEDIANTIYAVSHLMTSVTGQYVVADSGQIISYPYRKE